MDQRAERLARGEPAAFAELYDACADRVHHYLVVRLGVSGRCRRRVARNLRMPGPHAEETGERRKP